ncbi:MAG: hypothetical protein NC548_51620 [Lachnospiraceae bacterium]|nr:hypothetical protein [Lachnospiraceae bacterium]
MYRICQTNIVKRFTPIDVTEGYRYNERNELTERVRAGSLTRYRYDRNGSIVSEEEELFANIVNRLV